MKGVFRCCCYQNKHDDEVWQQCIPEEKRLKQKEFDKLWLQIYQRYEEDYKKHLEEKYL